MNNDVNDEYRQVELLWSDGSKEVCWIPIHLAIEDHYIHSTDTNVDAKIVKCYGTSTLGDIDGRGHYEGSITMVD